MTYLVDLGTRKICIPGTVTDEEWNSRLAASNQRYLEMTGKADPPAPKPRRTKARK